MTNTKAVVRLGFAIAAAFLLGGASIGRSVLPPTPHTTSVPPIHISPSMTPSTSAPVQAPSTSTTRPDPAVPVERPTAQTPSRSIEEPIQAAPIREPERQHSVSSDDRRYWSDILTAFGGASRSLSSSYVVLTMKENGGVLVTTNYLRSGYSNAPILYYDYSRMNESTVFGEIERILFGTSGETSLSSTKLKILLDGDTQSDTFQKFLFDRELQSFRFETNGFRNAEVHFAGRRDGFFAQKFDREREPARWVAKLNDCCVVSGIPTNVGRWADLSRIPFSRARTQVISLVWDTSTANTLKPYLNSTSYAHPDTIKDDPIGRIQRVFQSGNAGDPVIVMGHVEGSQFVVERNGRVEFKVPFATLTNLAVATQRPLILLGCYTADHFALHGKGNPNYAVGTLNLLHSDVAARRLTDALRQASNFQQFLTEVSSPDQYLWISNRFFEHHLESNTRILRAPIFQEYRGPQRLLRSIVGFFYLLVPCAMTGGC